MVSLDTRFIGFSQSANLLDKRSDVLDSISQPYTMQDIVDSIHADFSFPSSLVPGKSLICKTITGAYSGIIHENYQELNRFFEFDTSEFQCAIIEYAAATDKEAITCGTFYASCDTSGRRGAGQEVAIQSSIIDQSIDIVGVTYVHPKCYFHMYGNVAGASYEIIYTIRLYNLPIMNQDVIVG